MSFSPVCLCQLVYCAFRHFAPCAGILTCSRSIHNRGIIGHIEEVSIVKDQQGKKLGQKLLAALDSVAVSLGCYKTILDCSPENEPFYVKCKYENSGTEMSRYYEEPKESYYRG